MRKTIIHVNQHVIRDNLKTGARNPVITVKNGKDNTYAHAVDILDEHGTITARVVYSPDKPLSCGARVWIETYNGTIAETGTGQVLTREPSEWTEEEVCAVQAKVQETPPVKWERWNEL